MKQRAVAWVYVLKCGDGSFYTGWTNELEKRVRTHQLGKGGKYTRSRLPVSLMAAWRKKSPKHARRAEALFKQLTREQKVLELRRAKKVRFARVRSRANTVVPD